jgi:HlyD family secretion protein
MYLGAAAALAAVLFFAFRPEAIAVETGGALVGPMQVTVEEQGETRSHDRFVVASPVNGRLLRVVHHDGDAVRANEVVATIAPVPLSARERDELNARVAAAAASQRSAEAQLNHALEDSAQAKRESARIEELFERGLVARQPLEQAQNAATTLEKEVEAAPLSRQSRRCRVAGGAGGADRAEASGPRRWDRRDSRTGGRPNPANHGGERASGDGGNSHPGDR